MEGQALSTNDRSVHDKESFLNLWLPRLSANVMEAFEHLARKHCSISHLQITYTDSGGRSAHLHGFHLQMPLGKFLSDLTSIFSSPSWGQFGEEVCCVITRVPSMDNPKCVSYTFRCMPLTIHRTTSMVVANELRELFKKFQLEGMVTHRDDGTYREVHRRCTIQGVCEQNGASPNPQPVCPKAWPVDFHFSLQQVMAKATFEYLLAKVTNSSIRAFMQNLYDSSRGYECQLCAHFGQHAWLIENARYACVLQPIIPNPWHQRPQATTRVRSEEANRRWWEDAKANRWGLYVPLHVGKCIRKSSMAFFWNFIG